MEKRKFNLLGIEMSLEEYDFLMCEQAKGKELKVKDGKVVAEYHVPTEEEKREQYEIRINELIRLKYTLSQELAIIRQQAIKGDEYDAYFAYCEECKAKAKAEVYGDEI